MANEIVFNPFFDKEILFEVRQLILMYGTRISCPTRTNFTVPGEIIDTLYYIEKGRARCYYYHPEGEEKTLMILNEGSFFNEAAILDQVIAYHNAIISITTYDECTLYKIDKNTFDYLFGTSDIFRKAIGLSVSRKLYITYSHVINLSFNSCKDRLYQVLYATRDLNYDSNEGWYKLKYRYTQQELANIIGSTRVTVAKLISTLTQEGKVRVLNNKIEVKA
ncbi:MAG: Crp/Fnr family transcriptional regulator [Dehalobacter sp. 4CP]|uniref:Crp/Fnr family transcriptional regulator n=1 Tax=Dehalobacter sp. CP TaxID=2594474 RepID=UPI0013C896B2|nr:Crp/Fnr family transcriptional regulator [Dehalobacter sp. 4CP]